MTQNYRLKRRKFKILIHTHTEAHTQKKMQQQQQTILNDTMNASSTNMETKRLSHQSKWMQ